jgi:hypothetical protein
VRPCAPEGIEQARPAAPVDADATGSAPEVLEHFENAVSDSTQGPRNPFALGWAFRS